MLDLSPEAQTKAFSNLCAVILANPSKHTVVKPEKPEEKPAEKPADEKVGGITRMKKEESAK